MHGAPLSGGQGTEPSQAADESDTAIAAAWRIEHRRHGWLVALVVLTLAMRAWWRPSGWRTRRADRADGRF